MTDQQLIKYCSEMCDTTEVNYTKFADRVRELCRRFEDLNSKLTEVKECEHCGKLVTALSIINQP